MISEVRNLGELVNIKTGRLDANAMEKDGKFPFFTCAREIFRINNYAFDTKAILLAGNNASGDFNVKYYDGKFNAYQRTYVITINDENQFNYSYLKHKLEGHLKVFKNQALGANTRFLKIGMIKDLQIPLPSLDQQKKIAAILDAADAYRQKTKALIEEYDELTQSLFLDMFGDMINNQKDWNYIPFGKVFNALRYGTSSPPVYSKEGIPFIRATNVKEGGIVLKGMAYISQEEASKIQKCKLKESDLIIVRSGANTGDCSRIPRQFHGAYGGFDIIIEIDEPYSTYYNFLINTKSAKALIEPLTRRAGQPHLNSKQITELEVFDIPLNLQNLFAERVQAIEAQKAQAQASLAQAEDLFNSLLQRAFKGELS